MKLVIIFICLVFSIVCFNMSHETHVSTTKNNYNNNFKSSLTKKIGLSKNIKNQQNFDLDGIFKILKGILSKPEYKMAQQEISCEKQAKLPDFSLLGDFGTTFGPIFTQMASQNPDFSQCFGNFILTDQLPISETLLKNAKLCERLPLQFGTTYSILATDFGKDMSICSAFTKDGTFAISVSSKTVQAFEAFKKDSSNTLLDILFSLKKVLLDNPIDLGVSFERKLQLSSRIPIFTSKEIEEQIETETIGKDGKATKEITTQKKIVNNLEIQDVHHRGHIFFYLPRQLNILRYFSEIDPKIRDAVEINCNTPVLLDFGPITAAFGDLSPAMENLGKAMLGDQKALSSAPSMFVGGFGDFLKNTFKSGAEILARISGEIKIRIPGLAAPVSLRTSNLSLFAKTMDVDIGNSVSKSGVYINVPPEAHEQFHKIIRDELLKIKIYLPEKPSTEIGLMFTDRFGIVVDIKDIGVTWKCSVPWGGNIFTSPDCGLYIK